MPKPHRASSTKITGQINDKPIRSSRSSPNQSIKDKIRQNEKQKRTLEIKRKPDNYEHKGNRYKPSLPLRGQQGGKYPGLDIQQQRTVARRYIFSNLIGITYSKVTSTIKNMKKQGYSETSIDNVCSQWETNYSDNLLILLNEVDIKLRFKNKQPGLSLIGHDKEGKKVYCLDPNHIVDDYLEYYPLDLIKKIDTNVDKPTYSLF